MERPDIDAIERTVGHEPHPDEQPHIAEAVREAFNRHLAVQVPDLIAYIRHLEVQRAELLPWARWGLPSTWYHAIDEGMDEEWPEIENLGRRIDAGEFGEVQS